LTKQQGEAIALMALLSAWKSPYLSEVQPLETSQLQNVPFIELFKFL